MCERFIYMVVLATTICALTEAGEYCDKENFKANCAPNQVILIQRAKYGRMSSGRCIEGEGQMGCEHDVTQKLHTICSGRQTCQFEVSDIGKEREPCKKDFTSYLDAEFKCQDLTVGEPSQCGLNRQIVLTSEVGLLPSLAHSTNVGVQRCPWSIQAKQGQQVQLNISVFNASSSKLENGGKCHYSVMLKGMESHIWHRREVCGYTWGQTHIYTSAKNTLQVYNAVTQTSPTMLSLANAPSYVLHYRVIGCADVVAPSFSSVIRTGNDLVVKCNRTKETWFLTCKGNKWIGEMGNCTRSSSPVADSVTSSDIPYPQGLIAAVVLGLVLGVLIGFTSLGIYVIHRRRKFQRGLHYPQEQVPLPYDPSGKQPQYGEVPLYQESGSSSTYFADSGYPSAYGGTSLKRTTHVCDQDPAGSTLQEPMGGGGALGTRGGIKMTLHVDQQQQSFVQQGLRRDLL